MTSETAEFEELLDRILTNTGAIPFSQLYALSDISRERLPALAEAWEILGAPDRRRLIHALVDLAEASFEVNYDAIYRHCLSDPDPEVRAVAIDGLWENEEMPLIGRFITALRSDPAPEVRAAAATALGRFVLAGELERIDSAIQNRIRTELLTIIHLEGESLEVRRRALESASYACTPETTEALDAAYYHGDERLRLSAIVAMGRSCDRRWQGLVLTELESSSAAMRYEAALAAGELMIRPAVPILARLMADHDLQVRDAAIWALGQIGGPHSKRLLLEAYEGADEDTQAILDEALAEHALSEGRIEFPLFVDEDKDQDELGFDWDQEDDFEGPSPGGPDIDWDLEDDLEDSIPGGPDIAWDLEDDLEDPIPGGPDLEDW
jgi:HEAT repeat protein